MNTRRNTVVKMALSTTNKYGRIASGTFGAVGSTKTSGVEPVVCPERGIRVLCEKDVKQYTGASDDA